MQTVKQFQTQTFMKKTMPTEVSQVSDTTVEEEERGSTTA